MGKKPDNLIIKDNSTNLEDVKEYYESILAALPGNIYWLDRNNVYLGCNDNQAKSVGLSSRHEIIGKRNKDLPHHLSPNFEPEKLDHINQVVMESGKAVLTEEYGMTSDGKKLLFLSNKVPLFDAAGKTIGLLGVSIDITEQSKKNMVEYLDDVIKIMPGHVYWKNKQGMYLGCNEAQAKSVGFSTREELIGKTDFDLPWKEQAQSLRKIDDEIIKTGIPKTIEETVMLHSGEEAIFLSKKVPLLHKNEIIGILGISFDITEQKKLEKELKDTQTRLEGMTILGASIAHELRTPFASLNIAAKSLESKIEKLNKAYNISTEDTEAVQHEVASIKKEVKASLTFIDMLLLNINPTKNEAQIENFSIRDCITDALERFPFVGKQHELVHWDEKKNPDFIVRAEKLLVIHVLFNLLKNALYYIAKARKGSIEIWIENHTVYFKDTGTGISPEHLPHIFKRFFSKTYHGAGVGLTFCEWVMDNLGGKITCESEEGNYTLFILRFPNNT